MCEDRCVELEADLARERAAREAEREKRRAADERANEEARLHTQVTGELLRERSRLAAALDALRAARGHALKYSDFGGMSHWSVRQMIERINAALAGGGR